MATTPNHPNLAITHHNLALVLQQLGRRRDALTHARAAVVIRQDALPADHPYRVESEALYVELGGSLPVQSE